MLVALVASACSSGTNATDPRDPAAGTSGSSPGSSASPSSGGDGAVGTGTEVTVDGRQIYLTCSGTSPPGSPTVILVSGYHDSSDVWIQDDLLQLTPPAAGPPVLPALSSSFRVCAYDRPGTLRYVEGVPLTDRSMPVSQPRTTAEMALELHDLLAAARVPGPYLLVGHSLGGLVVDQYTRTYPSQVSGVVFVDAFSPTIPAAFGPLWPKYRDKVLNKPPKQEQVPSMRGPDSERVDLDASIAELKRSPEFPAVPVVVLTSPRPFPTLDAKTMPPGLTPTTLEARYRAAQNDLVAYSPNTPQVLVNGSGHYVQWNAPDTVVNAVLLAAHRQPG